MTRKLTFTGFAAAAVLIAVAAILAFSGTSSAQEDTPGTSESARVAPHDPNALLAIAIGVLNEDGEDEYATVDLRATKRFGKPGGAFRFYSEEHGYYNGGVRGFNCDDGVITAHGGGGLVQPDGTRIGVVYEAVFDTADGSATVTVKGKDGFEYTMEGVVDGLVWCGNPADGPPTA
jgi:hypothetical protein